jgi:hypothetical protein
MFREPRNRFPGIDYASLCSLAGRYDLGKRFIYTGSEQLISFDVGGLNLLLPKEKKKQAMIDLFEISTTGLKTCYAPP